MSETATVNKKATAKSNGKGNGNGHAPEPAQATTRKDLSIEQKIQKVADLNDLISKRNRFLDAKLKLNSFNLKREESTTRITISDSENNTFMTSHTDAIEKILSVLNASIEKGLADVEAKITF